MLHNYNVHCVLLVGVLLQLRRHGSSYDNWKVRWRGVFTEWGACHSVASTGHRLKLRSYLSTESTFRQTKSSEGKPHMRSQSRGTGYCFRSISLYVSLFLC